MKSKIICLCFCVGFLNGTYAQDRSFGTLPLVNKPKASLSEGVKIKETPEYKKALNVYEKLVAARGDFRYPVPTFNMTREERRAAGMDYDLLEIVLEKTAFDVCNSSANPEAAIAFLLGHELTHYYEKHAWRRGFASDYKDLNIGIKLDSLTDDVAHETEADYLGGFLAYSAGFGLFDDGPKVIADLYKAYKLDTLMPGYPSLRDRQTLSIRTSEKLQRLVDVFEMANLLTAIGSYPEAREFYRYVLMEYQSREIYNNLGVTAVLEAITYFKEGELKFRYPVELDLESSASKGSGMVDPRPQLLRQALLYFDAAISMDPDYAPAYLNKACAYGLLDDPERARFYAEKEALPAAKKENKYPKTALDVEVLLGILEATAGKTDAAKKLFKTAADAGSALAGINLKILNGETLEPESDTFGGFPRKELIDGKTINEISEGPNEDGQPAIDRSKTITLSRYLGFYQNPKEGPNSKVFICENSQGAGKRTLFHLTNPGYDGQTGRKIALKAERAAIVKAYGEPTHTVETPRGQLMVYKKIIFILGADGTLDRWVNYLIPD